MTALFGTPDPTARIPGRYTRAADELGHLNQLRDALLEKLRPDLVTLIREARAIKSGKLTEAMEVADCMAVFRENLDDAIWQARAYLENEMEEVL